MARNDRNWRIVLGDKSFWQIWLTDVVVSDNGTGFIGEEVKDYLKHQGIPTTETNYLAKIGLENYTTYCQNSKLHHSRQRIDH